MTLGILLTIISFAWWLLGFVAVKHNIDALVFVSGVLSIVAFAGALTAFFK